MKIQLGELFQLELEILGGTIGERVFVGLVNEEIDFKSKHQLQRVLKKLLEEKALFVESEKKLFISLGAVEEEGNLIIKDTLEDGSINPSLEKLMKERTELLKQEIDLGEYAFDIESFNFKSKSTYPVFMNVAFS
jgi:hypothetical protein